MDEEDDIIKIPTKPLLESYGETIDDLEIIRNYFDWESPSLNRLFMQLGMYGISLEDIASILGIAENEMQKKLEEYPFALENYKAGPALGRAQATGALYNNVAKGRSNDIQFYLKAMMPNVYGNNINIKEERNINVNGNVKVDITTLALQHLPTEYLENILYDNRSNNGSDSLRIETPERKPDAILVSGDGADTP